MSICDKDLVLKLQFGAVQGRGLGTNLLVASRELAQLNYRYLHMLGREGAPEKIRGKLAQISEPSLVTLSESFFSFFTLAFDDCDRWMTLMVDVDQTIDVNESKAADDPERAERANFVTSLVFFAWHLACADAIAVRAVLQLDERIAEELRRVPIGRLQAISVRASDLLAPRWIDNDFFWSALARCSEAPNDEAIQVVKLLGRQLLAGESLGLATGSQSLTKMPLVKSANFLGPRSIQAKDRANRGA